MIKSVRDIDRAEPCLKCNAESERVFTPQRLHLHRTAVQHAEYNPAFGQVVKNRQHREELARQRGLVEVGNEKPETIHKIHDQAREEKRKKAWEEV